MQSFETPTSSNIKAVEYEDQTRQMVVHFRNGGSYTVHDVDSTMYYEFKGAPAPGKFFHARIKERHRIVKHGASAGVAGGAGDA